MQREQFRQLILPLGKLETDLKNANDNTLMIEMLKKRNKVDHEGVLLFTNKQITNREKYPPQDLIHAPYSLPEFKNQLRLIYECRFSTIPMHRNEFINLYYVYSGKMILRLANNEKAHIVEAGHMVFMNQNVVHAITMATEMDIVFNLQIESDFWDKHLLSSLFCSNPVIEFLRTPQRTDSKFYYLIADCSSDDKMKLLFEDLYCEFMSPSLYSADLVEAYIRAIFVILMRAANFTPQTPSDSLIAAITHFIDANRSNCTLQLVADTFGFSPKYLSSLIKRKSGLCFSTLLTRSRMQAVVYYLTSSNLPIHTIAEICGYSNRNFFYKKFHDIYNLTPKEYRDLY